MMTMRALKRAAVGPPTLGPAVGVPSRRAETLQALAPKPALTFRLSNPGPAPQSGSQDAAGPTTKWAGGPDNVVAPAADTALSGTAMDAWTLELTPPERQYLEQSLNGLTGREREVVFAICSGGTNESLADRLCIALPTVRTHLMRLNQKLGTTSKGDVVRFVSSRLLDGYRRREISPVLPQS